VPGAIVEWIGTAAERHSNGNPYLVYSPVSRLPPSQALIAVAVGASVAVAMLAPVVAVGTVGAAVTDGRWAGEEQQEPAVAGRCRIASQSRVADQLLPVVAEILAVLRFPLTVSMCELNISSVLHF
jgi:hypothetical protein